jgi:LacI family transcriptional regulator
MVRRRTTLKDVASAVGVHVSTVSRALNPHTRHFIRDEVVNRILEVCRDLHYKPNAAAYSLRTNRTRIIGVLIPDITNPVFPPIIRGIEDVLFARGYMAIVVNTVARNEMQASLIGTLQARGVDGLIVASLERSDSNVSQIAKDGLPIVTVNRRSDDDAIPSVTNDEDTGLRLILEHLKSLGHHRVANISGPLRISTGKNRYDAFERHRRTLGFDLAPGLVLFADQLNEEDGERLATAALDTLGSISALVASNDRLAVGAIAALQKRGIVCPDDISVTGFNDMPMVDRLQPSLTTVRVQQYQVGERAAELMLERIESNGEPAEARHVVTPVELIVRASTGPAKVLGKANATNTADPPAVSAPIRRTKVVPRQ